MDNQAKKEVLEILKLIPNEIDLATALIEIESVVDKYRLRMRRFSEERKKAEHLIREKKCDFHV